MSFPKSNTLVHFTTNEVDVVVMARVQQSGNGFYGNVPLLGPILIQMRAGNRQKGSASYIDLEFIPGYGEGPQAADCCIASLCPLFFLLLPSLITNMTKVRKFQERCIAGSLGGMSEILQGRCYEGYLRQEIILFILLSIGL